MMVKSFVFLSCLLGIIGCGVMSNPAPEDAGEKALEIADGTLMIDGNISFLFSGHEGGITELTSYKIFETQENAEAFFSDINNTAKTLVEKERIGIEEWIARIYDANINYHDNNLLFYPLFQSEECGINDNISIENNNVIITVEAERLECEVVPVYHMLVYSIDKEIVNISMKAFDQGIVTFPNKASE